MKRNEILAKKEYDKLSLDDLENLEYTKDWEKDKKRFIIEWKLTQDILNDDKWNVIEEEDDYGNI